MVDRKSSSSTIHATKGRHIHVEEYILCTASAPSSTSKNTGALAGLDQDGPYQCAQCDLLSSFQILIAICAGCLAPNKVQDPTKSSTKHKCLILLYHDKTTCWKKSSTI